MSINARLFYGLKCDICGHEDEDWYDTPEECRNDCEHVDWLHLCDGRDVCSDCITIDDNDNYVTKDGGVYDYETLKLINVK